MAQTRKDPRGRVLRKGESQLMKDQMDGLDIYVADENEEFLCGRYLYRVRSVRKKVSCAGYRD